MRFFVNFHRASCVLFCWFVVEFEPMGQWANGPMVCLLQERGSRCLTFTPHCVRKPNQRYGKYRQSRHLFFADQAMRLSDWVCVDIQRCLRAWRRLNSDLIATVICHDKTHHVNWCKENVDHRIQQNGQYCARQNKPGHCICS